MSSIDEVLAERGSRYGEFIDHATVTQGIKNAMAQGENWGNMDDDQQECLEMIAHKIGRILNGDPNYADSWTDIIGYTRLVEKRLLEDQTPPKPKAPPTDKELADKLRGMEPGLHIFFVDEDSGEID